MDSLPSSSLVKIFENLPPNDLLTLVLVCKRFNTLISETDELIEKLQVKLYRSNITSEWIKTRPYRRLAINSIFFSEFLPMIIDLQSSVIEIVFTDFNSPKQLYDAGGLDTLAGVSNGFTNLRDLTLGLDMIFTSGSLPFLNLDLNSLSLTCNDYCIQMFLLCQVRVLRYKPLTSNWPTHFENFLRVQTNLCELTIRKRLQNLFRDDTLTQSAEFCLEKIEIENIGSHEVERFVEFLMLHIETLTHVKVNLNYREILEILPQFTRLKSLVVDVDYGGELVGFVMEHVESLSIRNFYNSTVKVFPSLHHLTLVGSEVCERVENLEKLTTVTIKGHCNVPVSIPQVKKLSFKCLGGIHHTRPFIFEKSYLREMHLVRARDESDWLEEFRESKWGKNVKIFNLNHGT